MLPSLSLRRPLLCAIRYSRPPATLRRFQAAHHVHDGAWMFSDAPSPRRGISPDPKLDTSVSLGMIFAAVFGVYAGMYAGSYLAKGLERAGIYSYMPEDDDDGDASATGGEKIELVLRTNDPQSTLHGLQVLHLRLRTHFKSHVSATFTQQDLDLLDASVSELRKHWQHKVEELEKET